MPNTIVNMMSQKKKETYTCIYTYVFGVQYIQIIVPWLWPDTQRGQNFVKIASEGW